MKEENRIRNLGVGNGTTVLFNSSRGNTESSPIYDYILAKISQDLELNYTEKLNYNANQYNSGLGSSIINYTIVSADSNGIYRGNDIAVENYKLCSITLVNNGYKFPQNYTHYAYNLFNQTAYTRRNTSISGSIQLISQLEFPQIFAAWDPDGTHWILNNRIVNEDPVNNLQMSMTLGSVSFYNGTLTSGTILTNTEANLSLSPGASIYVS